MSAKSYSSNNDKSGLAILLLKIAIITTIIIDTIAPGKQDHNPLKTIPTMATVTALSIVPSLLTPEIAGSANHLFNSMMNSHHHAAPVPETMTMTTTNVALVMEQLKEQQQHHNLFGGLDLHFLSQQHRQPQETAARAALSSNSLSSHLISSSSSSSTEMKSTTLSTLMANYRIALKTEPLKTKMTTGSILAVVADAMAQSTTMKKTTTASGRTAEENGTVDADQASTSLTSSFFEQYNMKRAVAFAVFDACWRAVQQLSYPPLYKICDGHFTIDLLSSVSTSTSTASLGAIDQHLLAAWEQTLVSQLVLIPGTF